MTTNSSISLVRRIIGFWRDFYLCGSKIFLLVLVASIPSILLIYFSYPKGIEFITLSVLSCGIYLATLYTRDQNKNTENRERKQKTRKKQAGTYLGILTLYFTFNFLISTYIAQQVHDLSNIRFLAVLLALYYPVIDFDLIYDHKKSLGGIPLLLLFRGFRRLGLLDNSEIPLDDVIDDLVSVVFR